MILLPLYSKMLIKVNAYEDINPKFIATKHQVHFQPMLTASSNTEGTQLKCKEFPQVDNVQRKCKTSLTSFLDLLASTVSM